MRTFLDTNVVLTGTFNHRGPAGILGSLGDPVTFLHSPRVLQECSHLIARDAPTAKIERLATECVLSYLAQLRSECVPDCMPPAGILARDPDDDLILGAAIASGSDMICTYNVKDFPADRLAICTPLTIHRKFSDPTLEQYIQKVMLGSQGTMLFFGRLHHPGSMGTILTSENGTKVSADNLGFVHLVGPEVSRCRAIKPLRANEEFRLTVRYNKSDFEAALWGKKMGYWEKDLLSSGTGSFSERTLPNLFFVPSHQFFGHIQCISGLPRFVRDKHLLSALDNYSLEAVAGSLDLRWFFEKIFTNKSI